MVSPERLQFHEVDAGRWRDLERLFEAAGGPKYCWCMAWRPLPGKLRTDPQAKKAALEHTVRQGVPVGILGYLDGEPVAWCSVAPRTTYRGLGVANDSSDSPEAVWSIVCFFVVRRLRRQGVMKHLLAAAVEHAKGKGAKIVEAYPVDPDSPSYRFMGFVSAFKAAGFQEVARAGSRRHVMRLTF